MVLEVLKFAQKIVWLHAKKKKAADKHHSTLSRNSFSWQVEKVNQYDIVGCIIIQENVLFRS